MMAADQGQVRPPVAAEGQGQGCAAVAASQAKAHASVVTDQGQVRTAACADENPQHAGGRPSSPKALEARGLACGYGGHAVVSDVSFALPPGGLLALLGPNGVGKTTLFKTLLGFLEPLAGSVAIDGRDTASFARRDFARMVAYLPQSHTPSFAFRVREVVLMGRTPYLEGAACPSEADEQIAWQAMEAMGVGRLAERDYSSLSGGERQMVLIARALAQQPRILVMDEPCASLDFGNQARLLEQVLDLAEGGMAVVMTTHDPNHAFMLDGEVLCLGRGGVAALGRARDVLSGASMGKLYGVPVAAGPIEGEPAAHSCVPLLRRRS